jgi:hypothetical protein
VWTRLTPGIRRGSRVFPSCIGCSQFSDGELLVDHDSKTSLRCHVAQSDSDSRPSFAKFLLGREIDFGLDETEMAFFCCWPLCCWLAYGMSFDVIRSDFPHKAIQTTLAICIAMERREKSDPFSIDLSDLDESLWGFWEPSLFTNI